jgi:preprotein translocase subunit SecE
MARDRQRSKARQQQRRDERLAQRREAAALGGRPEEALVEDGQASTEQDPIELADLEVGAPPEDVGRSARTLREEPPLPSFETDDEALGDDLDLDVDDGGATTTGPRGVRGERGATEKHERARVVAFLVAVWAELKRVQWPDRRQLTQLTGVVLFFVLIVGAYLGALDAIFSKLISQIL